MDIMQKLAANEAEINALERATQIGVQAALREARAKQAVLQENYQAICRPLIARLVEGYEVAA